MRDANRHSLPARTFAARRLFSLAALLSVACFYFQAPHQASAQSLSSREYEIKAAYLYNFIKYVDWPSYGDTITIGVLGNDPFGAALAPLNGKIVKGRRLLIKQLDSFREAQQCQIIFLSSSAKQRLPERFERWKP